MKEVLTIINDKAVESSLGWRVHIPSIDTLQYQEDGKTILFKIEDYPDVYGELEWTIHVPADPKWLNADSEETVSDDKMDEIVERINLAFWTLDMKIKEIS
jgi:hypothetical protein